MVRAFGNNRDRPHLLSHKTWSVPYFPFLEIYHLRWGVEELIWVRELIGIRVKLIDYPRHYLLLDCHSLVAQLFLLSLVFWLNFLSVL
jgi:hypothetical protein